MIEQSAFGRGRPRAWTAVFFTRAKDQTPPVMAWHVRKNRALHEYVLALTLTVLSVPWTDPEERLKLQRVDDKFWRAEARRGFMEHPDIPEILANARRRGWTSTSMTSPTMSAAKPSCRARTARECPRWQEALFAAIGRNAERISDYLELPCDHVVEIGREIEI